MPISTTCSRCQTVYALPDNMRGKYVRCKKCQGVIAVGGAAPPKEAEDVESERGESDRSGKIQTPTRRPNRASAAPEETAPVRRRPLDYDDEEPEPRRASGGNRGLMIGLIGCSLALVLVLGGGGIILGVVLLKRSGPTAAADGSGTEKAESGEVDLGGAWPNPRGLPGWAADSIAVLHIAGVGDEATREAVQDKIGTLVDAGNRTTSSASHFGDRMTVFLAPVRNPQAMAKKIDFGTVHSVDDRLRLVTVIARRVEGPPPNADTVTKALYHLKSSNAGRRADAARRLKDTRPDERRAQVSAALTASLGKESDNGVRQILIEALGVWGDKEAVPALLKAIREKDTRLAAIRALGKLKDERAIEPIAESLQDFFERGVAVEALKGFGPVAEKAMIQRLSHPNQDVRLTACDILKVIGTQASIPTLERMVAENNFFVSPKAKETIQAINGRK